ncbi:hypothetical protein [Rheinheimera sp. MM224]|uniref:hypothetical protein n=1 Tax=Rheinheimera sp. MM224 TaxID=3019969 RepID=UPI0021F85E8C|nr:hypothetical protein [Rheinheimera sp. MM224]CAI3790894.1 hypothetical protein JAMGFMIE_00156 [Rheinheimera sp. MM224]
MFFPKEKKLLNLSSMIAFSIVGWYASLLFGCEAYYPLLLLFSLIYYYGCSADQEHYIDEKTGDMYDASYVETSFTFFVSIFWVVVGYRGSGLITIDIALFFFLSLYLAVAWFMICFIPKDGFSEFSDHYIKSFLMLVCMFLLAFYVVWFFYSFKGWGVFSHILSTPYYFIFK